MGTVIIGVVAFFALWAFFSHIAAGRSKDYPYPTSRDDFEKRR